MTLRRNLLLINKQNKLPSEYRVIDWLQGTGTQYIDLGYKPTLNTHGEISYSLSATYSGDQIMCGTRNTTADNGFVIELYSSYSWYGRVGLSKYGPTLNAYGAVLDRVYTIAWDSSNMTISWNADNTVVSQTAQPSNTNNGVPDANILLFCLNRNGSPYYYTTTTRIHRTKLFENGALAADLVPCVRLTDYKPGMYDLVRKIFLTNAGTGEFSTSPIGTIAYEASNLSFDGTANTIINTGVYLFTQENINRDFEFIAENIDSTGEANGENTIICAKHNSNAYGFFVRIANTSSIKYNGTINVWPVPASMVIRRINGVITLSGTNIRNPGVAFTNAVFDWPLMLGCAVDDSGNMYRFREGTIDHVLVKWLN